MDQAHVDAFLMKVEAQGFQKVAHRCLRGTVSLGAGQWQVGRCAGSGRQPSRFALFAGGTQQRQGGFDAVEGAKQVGRKNALYKVYIEVLCIQVFTGARVEQRHVQRAQPLPDLFTGGQYRLAVADI